jgi:DNA replication and repair protein RecF
VTRVGEYLGRFPTVVFSSQDQQLIRGSPSLRRRWLDLTLAAMDGGYLRALQQYHRALTERNALLKRGTAGDVGQLEAFEQPLAAAAAEIVAKREEGVRIAAAHVLAAYSQIARSGERAEVTYEADALARTEAEWLERFAKSRSRDQLLKSTSVGPHRDDFGLQIDGRAARDFGSEGQQRSLVIALRLAQLTYFRERASVEPILLADDVLGELDPQRRERFWESIGHTRQVIATGTRLPEADLGRWQIFQVENGTFTPAGAGGVR